MAPEDDALRRVGTIWALRLDQPTPVIQPLVEARFGRLGPESARVLAEAAGDSAGGVSVSGVEEDFCRRFEAGRRCYAGWVGERLAVYGWVSFGEEYVGELSLYLNLTPCEAYIWDCVTVPAFRQKYLYSALLGYILEQLRSEPLCRAWIGADLDNQPSQRGIDRAGFQRIADLAIRPGVSDPPFEILPYPGVPASLAAEASRVFLGI